MEENGSGAARGGNGLITAGLVIAALVAAGAYLSLRDDGTLSDEAVAALTETDATADQSSAPVVEIEPSANLSDAAAGNSDETPLPDDEVSTAQIDTEADADQPQDAAVATPAPRIDEVRFDGNGILVVAGRAQPGSQVDVLIDGDVITTVKADAGGAFAALGSLSADNTARTLTLREGSGEAARLSEEEIILAPVATADTDDEVSPDGIETAEATTAQDGQQSTLPGAGNAPTDTQTNDLVTAGLAPETAREVAEATDFAQNKPEASVAQVDAGGADTEETPATGTLNTQAVLDTDTAQAEATVGGTVTEQLGRSENSDASSPDISVASAAVPNEIAATGSASDTSQQEIAVLRSDREGVSVVSSAPVTSVELDTIGYSDAGNVELSGRAAVGSVEIRAYLNNRVVAQLPVDQDGSWRGEVPDVDAGVYTLRVDAVAEDGTVASRIETPFKREDPTILAAATAGVADGLVRSITVQAGDTLWAIARERYGDGIFYVQVYEANLDDIRDPDLIYPGQVFDLPRD